MPAQGSDPRFRPNVYVIARFLDALARPDVVLTRSQLQAAVGVNYDMLRRYVDFLSRRGYASVDQDRHGTEVVRITVEGRRVREELVEWIRRFLGGSYL